VEKEDIIESVMREVRQFDVAKIAASKEAALANLASMAETKLKAPPGPVQVGTQKSIFTPTAISEMAAHYYSAFAGGFQCFPYFAGESNGRK
jgi:hypothetical protein